MTAAREPALREDPGTRGALLDVVAVVVSLALVLTLLDESYWSRTYLVAGLVPVVWLLGLALLLRGLPDGIWAYAILAVVSYAPVGALAALQRPGPWYVPTGETMAQVLGDTVRAPGLFVSTMPPVEASGTLVVLPYAIGFLSAAPAAWLALGTDRPVAPAVSVLGGLAATVPVAVLVPDHLVARGVVLGVLLVTWVTVRARRREPVVGTSRGSVAAAALSLVVVTAVSLGASLLVPDDDQTDRVRLSPRGDSEAVAAAAADSVVPGENGREVLFRVTDLPEGRRMRFGALDHYDGSAWVPAGQSPGTGAAGTFRRLSREITPLHDGPRATVRVEVRPGYVSEWLPTVGELATLDLDVRDGRTQLAEVRYNQETSSAVVVGGVDPRDDYVLTAVLPPDRLGRGVAMSEADDEQRQPEGAFLDRYLVPFDRGSLTPTERVLLLARYLRQNGEVRLTGGSSQAPVDLGLRLLGGQRMVATPFQYTAVMALGASRLGVPARVVVGARPGRGGVVRHTDVEAWVELRAADGTWRTLEPDRYVGVHPYAEDEVESLPAGTWVGKELGDDAEIKIPRGADIELGDDAVFEERTDPWSMVAVIVVGVAALFLLALALVPAVRLLRRARRRRSRSWSAVHVGAWQEVLDQARDNGTPVPDSWSRVAQARALGLDLDTARRADAAVFAPVPTAVEDTEAFWAHCQLLRREIARRPGPRRRCWAFFSPASLLAGRARRRSGGSAAGRGQLRDEDRRPRRQQAAGA